MKKKLSDMELARVAVLKQLRKPFFSWKRILVEDVKSCMLFLIVLFVIPFAIFWCLFKCLLKSLPLIIAIVLSMLILKWMGVL